MSDILLQNRMTTLEEMMVRLTGNVERTTENLERLGKELRASHEEMREEHRQFREERKAEQKEWNKRWEQSREEWDKRWDKLSEDRKAEKKEWNRRWGKLSNKWGTMVEDLVGPSLPRLLREVAPCPPDDEPLVQIRAYRRHPKQRKKIFHIDGVVDSGEYALFCECFDTLEPADITKLVSKLAQAREYFPEYADHYLLGAVAALHIKPSLVQYASNKGILAFAVGEELMDVQNEAGFTPRRF